MTHSNRILVTGSAGFMGSWVAHRLAELGYEVYGVDNMQHGDKENIDHNKQRFTVLDLRNRSYVEDYIQYVKPEYLFHLAATAREGASQFSPILMTENNLNAYMNVLTACIKTKKLKKVVLFSSMSVYGNQEPPFDETFERKPEDIYAVAKAAMERNTEILSDVYGFRYTIIRPHNVAGENQSLSDLYRNVVAIFMNRIMRNEPIYIYGDGEQTRAFSYIADSLDCYCKCIEEVTDGHIINIGGIYHITINKLAEIVIEAMGEKSWKIIHLKNRPREVKHAYCTYEKSVSLLGYEEKVGIWEGIYRMAHWAKRKGPQPWTFEKLEIYNEKTPITWFPDFDNKSGCRGHFI